MIDCSGKSWEDVGRVKRDFVSVFYFLPSESFSQQMFPFDSNVVASVERGFDSRTLKVSSDPAHHIDCAG